MNAAGRRAWLAGVAVTASVFAASGRASADSLSRDETARLGHGETVVRSSTLEGDDYRYVGGVAYSILDGQPDELTALLDDVETYRAVLPRTISARVVGTVGGDALVELHQGTSMFEVAYTIRVRKDPAHGAVRFWLDRSRAHGIDDAWGFFRLAPLGDGRVLLTFGALVDVGEGMLRLFFEERVRAAMMSVPSRMQRFLERRHVLARALPLH